MTEPTNAELKTLLESLSSQSSAVAREQASSLGELKSEISAVRVKVHELDSRVHKVETDHKRLRDSQAEIEGGLMAEVGALAAHDQEQTKLLRKLANWHANPVLKAAIVLGAVVGGAVTTMVLSHGWWH